MSPFEGSAVAYDFHRTRNVGVAMRDGTVLSTDVYLPALKGKPVDGAWPVVLERTPYDKSRRVSHSQTGRYFARRGYAVVLQDVRGRWSSEGDFEFLRNEADDGYDTLTWIGEQEWCNGKIGTVGYSYTAADQQSLAIKQPPHLVTQQLFDGGYNYFNQTFRHAGACEYAIFFQYVLQMARQSKEAAADPEIRDALDRMWANLGKWIRRLPLRRGESPLRLVPKYENWFFDMLTRSDYEDYWKDSSMNLEESIDSYPDIPVYLETSWYGHHITATLTKYAEMRRRHQTPKKLLIGTWTHGMEMFVQSWAGEVDFGAEAALENVNDIRLRWCDQYLKGLKTGLDDEPPVRIFVMGGGTGRRNLQGRLDHGGRWRDEQDWPPPGMKPTPYYLHGDGSLSTKAPKKAAAPSEFTFNPADPVPTIGGNFPEKAIPGFLDGGGFDQRGRPDLVLCQDTLPLSARRDVLTFRTKPLAEDMELTGPLVVRLWVSSTAVDTDFTAKLLDEYPPNPDYPEGFALNITDSIVRMRYRDSRDKAELMKPGTVYEISIEPQATSNLFARGHCIRVDISSSNFPHYDINSNTGEPLGLERRTMVAHQTVFHDAERPSQIILPIVPAGRR
ncbi:MAG: CocE/NonD family hydrolase [Rhizobiales bacterium]|nr:CocE/NonD family hydrolase [Hyphomicrobiales bacterium]